MEAAQSSKETRVFPRRLHNRAPPSRVTSRGYCGLEEMYPGVPMAWFLAWANQPANVAFY